ncbi:hypothetical protein N7456_001893 [Penicillium angulare]|uniref:Uncharacterized protein n=1 Tax=Penicillium angulare TaxID=116970 RepID=A0A9W9G7C5_9EURO|nr:hypothetical protein N7456_001893 [Penicillium angulare]
MTGGERIAVLFDWVRLHLRPWFSIAHGYQHLALAPVNSVTGLHYAGVLRGIQDHSQVIACPLLTCVLVRSQIFRSGFLPSTSFIYTRNIYTGLPLFYITTEFITHDTKGNLVTRKVPTTIGTPEDAFIFIDAETGNALRAASSFTSASAASAEYRCNLTFFHDTRHFGFGPTSYPRLCIPNQLPRQTKSNTSPATLWMSAMKHHLVLDRTADAIFAEHADASFRNLRRTLDRLKDM